MNEQQKTQPIVCTDPLCPWRVFVDYRNFSSISHTAVHRKDV